jgi:hypothetical protein
VDVERLSIGSTTDVQYYFLFRATFAILDCTRHALSIYRNDKFSGRSLFYVVGTRILECCMKESLKGMEKSFQSVEKLCLVRQNL